MTLHLGIPAIVSVVGAVLYGFTNNKLSEIGRILFFCGTLVVLMNLK